MVSYNAEFNPIQCTSQVFNRLSPQEGFLYFVTDTKQMFLGKDGKFIDICGGLNIVYGKKDIEYENSGQTPDPNVDFAIYQLEKEEYPLVGDLILNTDGCFYRVKSINEEGMINTTRLTLQGSGGGGSSSGGPTSGGGSYSVNVPISNNVYSSTATEMDIEFIGFYQGTDDNYINYVAFSIGGAIADGYPAFYEVPNAYYTFNETHSISLIDFIDLFGQTATSVYINTTDKYGSPRSKKFYIQVVDLSLTAKQPIIISSLTNSHKYSCAIDGAQSGLSSKELVFNFYNENSPGVPLIDPIIDNSMSSSYTGPWQTELNLSALGHGSYIMTVQAIAKIAGSSTTIESNILSHKISKFDSDINSALFTAHLPDKVEQHTNIPLSYLLTSAEENKVYTLAINIDGKEETRLNITTNALDDYTLYFDKKGNYSLLLTVLELGLEWRSVITVTEYTDELPIIKPDHPSLMLYLTPKGQSNNSITKDKWVDYNGLHTAVIENGYFSDASGWLEDSETGTPYLLLTSGAGLTIPTFEPFKNDPTKVSSTDSSMGLGMTIEIDFEVNGVTDYDAELIKCLSVNQRGTNVVGFTITGKNATFYSREKNGLGENGVLSKLNLVEGKRIRLSYVIEPNDGENKFPLFTSYINGIISGAAIYSTSDSFEDSTAQRAKLEFNSEAAQIKIYGVRFYSTALSDNLILQNYTASLDTLEEKQKRYDSNNVYTSSGAINYDIVSSEGYNLEIPYMTIVGGWKTDAKMDKWRMLPAEEIGQAMLPTGKKDYRLIDVKVVYPKIPLFDGYKNYSYTNVFDNGKGMQENFGNKPSGKTGCIMYAQGTSSMEYPVKNLRLRFRAKDDYFTVKPSIAPVEIICMKADYMESSGSHNTGAANLVDKLYSGAGYKSPGQEHFGPTQSNPDKKEIVTCIKGHPCLIFYSPTGEKGTFEYVGKYNLNLDKATPEPFGFNHDDTNFGYLKPGDEYYKVTYYDEEDSSVEPWIGQLDPAEGGDYFPGQTEVKAVVQENEKVNAIHCFEFLDNAVDVCNFLNRPKAYIKNEAGELVPDPVAGYYTYEETWYNAFDKDGDMMPGWCAGFESRYPEDRVGFHDADMLYPFASWLNALHYDKLSCQENINKAEEALALAKESGEESAITTATAELNAAKDALAVVNKRFLNEYQFYLDKNFTLFYYIVTETLLMADSRVKNMMIATWGKEDRTFIDADGNSQTFRDYVWYPIFYDMDTMLGLDNTGVDRFNYYDEDTNPSIYNGGDVLWNFVRDNLELELNQMYKNLEDVAFHIDIEPDGSWHPSSVINYFNKNQANMANEAFYNADALYKYIRPARDGYFDGLHNEPVDPGAAPFLYAAQGDRSLMREFFIVNRIKFLRGKRGSGKFKTQDRIDFRWYYPTGAETEFIGHESSITNVKPTLDFEFTSLQTCYAGAVLGANSTPVRERFDGEEKKNIVVPGAANANGTEAYLLGVSNLKDLGDLSRKYPQKFYIMGDNKLAKLTLGNPNKHYYNPYWKNEINLAGCTYLQEFNLQNCSTYSFGLNFEACPIIERILVTGSNPSSLKLPPNGVLRELRLPTSLPTLNIDSHQYLTAENFSIGTYDYGTADEIGKGNGYVNDYGFLQDISIINTPINTYEMLVNAISLESYCVQGFNWEITGTTGHDQYVTTKDSSIDGSKQYYIWDESQGKYVSAQVDDLLNKWSLIKEKVSYIQNNEIVAIPILDQLLTKTPKKNGINITQKAALSGTIHITVPKGVKCNQFSLYQKYNKEYPNVNIVYTMEDEDDLVKAYKIEFFNVLKVTNDTEPYFTVLTDGSYTFNELISENGPAGMALTLPVIAATPTVVYNFQRMWEDVSATPSQSYHMDIDFDSKPAKDMRLQPVFSEATHYYPIKFYDYNGANPITVNYEYEQVISTHPDTPMFRGRPDDDNLGPYDRYEFKGWIEESDFRNNVPNPTIINLREKKVLKNMELFPFYQIEDAREKVSNMDYFSFREKELKITKYNPLSESNEVISLGKQYIVDIKDEYKGTLEGKVTLPAADSRGKKVTAVGSLFYSEAMTDVVSNITHIFFPANSSYEVVGDEERSSGFYQMQKLNTIYFPEDYTSLKYIAENGFAFSGNTAGNLDIVNFPSTIEYIGYKAFFMSGVSLEELPQNLTYLGPEAFYFAYNLKLTTLPSGLQYILNDAFNSCGALQMTEFGYDTTQSEMSAMENGIVYIGPQAFMSAGDQVPNVTLHNSITHLSTESPFNGYGAFGLIVRDNTGTITEMSLYNYFGTTKNPSLAMNV